MRIKNYHKKIVTKIFSILVMLALVFGSVPAPAYAVLYSPGETLNPACAPTDVNCGVISAVTAAGNTINLELGPTATTTGGTAELKFLELTANGTNYVALKAPDALAGNVLYILPIADGTLGQMLSTNGAGALSWATSTQTFTTGKGGMDFNVSSVSGAHTFNLPDASLTNRGVLTTGLQFIAGDKNFANDLVVDGKLIGRETLLRSKEISFATAVNYPSASAANGGELADFNNDGYLDLVTPSYADNSVAISVNLNNGNGTFAAKTDYAGGRMMDARTGDFDGDGDIDIVSVDRSGTYSVFINNGSGAFAAAVNYTAVGGPDLILVRDFNGDGKLDFVASVFGTNTVAVYMGNGNGTFANGVSYTTSVGTADGFDIADITGDGKEDLVVVSGSGVSVLPGNSNGTFGTAITKTTGFGGDLNSANVADINNDGKLDLVAGGLNQLSVLLGTGGGNFANAVSYGAGGSNNYALLYDFDGDGDMDAVGANFGDPGDVDILTNNGAGVFTAHSTYGAGSYALIPKVADVNNDGQKDLIVINQTGDTSVLINSAKPIFYAQSSSGNVGIGTATPTEKLHIQSGTLLIDNPASPTLAGTYDTTGNARGLYISGKYAYVADFGAGLQIIDISNPSSPILTGTYNTTGSAFGVHVAGKYAYVADYASGLQIIDISNPASPTLTATYDTVGAYGLYIAGKYAYVADDTAGLRIIDISNPASPTVVGTYNTSGSATGVYVSGKYAYVADDTTGLQIIDISNPASPTLAGTYDTTGSAFSVQIVGKYAYVADYASGLQIIDISNPASPTLAGTYDTTGSAIDVHISGKYAYVADDTAGLQIIDISNPASPTLAGTYNTTGNASDVYISGKYAYVADMASGLQIIDIEGADIHAAKIGSIETNTLNAINNVDVGNILNVGNSLNVGVGGILSSGALAVSATNVASYFAGNVGIGTTTPSSKLHIAGVTTVGGHILPNADNTYDLGSSTMRFRDLYLGPASLHIGDNILSNTGGSLVWSGTSIEATASATSSTELKLTELSTNGSNYTGFKSPDALAANVLYTLPSADGTSGQSLVTNGTGGLSWASSASVSVGKISTVHHSVGTALAITTAHNNAEIHAESTGGFTIDGAGFTEDTFGATIVNTGGVSVTLTPSNFVGSFLRDGTTDAGFTTLSIEPDTAYKLTVTNNGGSKFLNVIKFAAGGSSQWTTSGSNVYYNTGNVAIGTSTPSASAKLLISGAVAAATAGTSENAGLVTTGATSVDTTTVPGETIVSYTATTGTNTFTPPTGVTSVRVVVVGGGASGGSGGIGGGGGAGRFRTDTALTVAAQSYTVTVGAGGAAMANNDNATGNAGSSSSFGALLVSEGGSGGGSWNVNGAASIGGSSGGGSPNGLLAGSMAGGATIAGERNPGGDGVALATNSTGGGGGGAGGGGGVGGTTSTSGEGGLGVSNNITGTSTFYAAGGGAARYDTGRTLGSPLGGSSIGGNGQAGTGNPPTAGAPNTGSGGGGKQGLVGTVSGAGGSGVVIVRFTTVAAVAGSVASDNALLRVIDTGSVVSSTLAFFEGTSGSGCIVAGGTGLTCSSDVRLKKNVETMNSALSNVLALKPVTYDWRSKNEVDVDGFDPYATEEGVTGNNIGFIAQDVEQIFPGLVVADPNGKKTLAYDKFAPLIVAALQEQYGGMMGVNVASVSPNMLFATAESLADDTLKSEILNPKSETNPNDQNSNDQNEGITGYLKEKVTSGIKIVRELVAERMVAVSGYFKRIFANELCLADSSGQLVCVTGENLKQIGGQTSALTPAETASVSEQIAPATIEATVAPTETAPIDTNTDLSAIALAEEESSSQPMAASAESYGEPMVTANESTVLVEEVVPEETSITTDEPVAEYSEVEPPVEVQPQEVIVE